MSATPSSAAALFIAGDCEARALTAADLPVLQRFFEDNPEYFHAVNGAAPRPDEAKQEFEDRPPAGMAYDEVFVIGFFDLQGTMVAMASVLSHLFARDVWHIGLFIVASDFHGQGVARRVYQAMEQWIRQGGARWLRLGAVAGNAKAERFWEKCGYTEVRRRKGPRLDGRTNELRVFLKPLGEAGLPEYLARVERDRPEPPAA